MVTGSLISWLSASDSALHVDRVASSGHLILERSVQLGVCRGKVRVDLSSFIFPNNQGLGSRMPGMVAKEKDGKRSS